MNEIKVIGIIYFSGTGNTKRIAEQIAIGVKDAGLTVAVYNVKDNPNIDQFDSVIICSPVYAWRAPWPVRKWIKGLAKQNGKKVFVFITYAGDDSNSILRLARNCQDVGFEVIGWGRTVQPETWTVVRTEKILRQMEEHAKDKPSDNPIDFGKTAVDILKGDKPPMKLPRFKTSAYDLVIPFYSKPALSMWFRIHVNRNRCTQCGLCAEMCPTGSIKLNPPYPRFTAPCAGCYGCVNLCPEEALESWFTRGKLRYKLK